MAALPTATVRELLAYAERGGASREWLQAAADELLAALLELQERREHHRRDDTLQTARQAAALRRRGVAAIAIAQRLGCSRGSVYRLVALGQRLAPDETVSADDGPGHQRRAPWTI